jgi:hypothetical protein
VRGSQRHSGESWKTGKQRDLTENRHSDSIKNGQHTLSQGKMKKGDDVADDDDDDVVHISQGGYRVLASTVITRQTSDEDVVSQPDSSASTTTGAGSSAHSSSGKQKRVDSVVVSAPQRGWRGRVLRRPGWLRGCTESAPEPGGGGVHRGWPPHWWGGEDSGKE